ncbi:MAG: hypothetical protein NTW29_13020 [Bacteroidetes bacterium]|nr:hypothetical protein [Bacteroidota bacterium]
MTHKFHCRVCGFSYDELHWGIDDKSPDYDICTCCGVEFGYEDFTIESVKNYRDNWIKLGMIWFVPKTKPDEWNWEVQSGNIPEVYK